jgi:hypothetical protein
MMESNFFSPCATLAIAVSETEFGAVTVGNAQTLAQTDNSCSQGCSNGSRMARTARETDVTERVLLQQ